MNNKQEFKVLLKDQSQLSLALDKLVSLGYYVVDFPKEIPNYLIAHATGRIGFEQVNFSEINLEQLSAMANQNNAKDIKLEIELIRKERPLFEANYIKNSRKLQFLKWDECDDGAGGYVVDWESIDEESSNDPEFTDDLSELAARVSSCLMAWVECAKEKQIPEGWVLAPIEPIETQKQAATLVTVSGGNILDGYKAMIHILSEQNTA